MAGIREEVLKDDWGLGGEVGDVVRKRMERALMKPLADYAAEEYERLWLEFMGLTERERWNMLRSWQYWKDEERAVVELVERVKEKGILAISDDDLARMHMHGWRISGKRPRVQTTTLGQLVKLREGSWQKECIKERERCDAAEKKIKALERVIANWQKKFDSELSLEKKRVEEETRRVVVDQMRGEFELRERVKGGVEEAFGSPTNSAGG